MAEDGGTPDPNEPDPNEGEGGGEGEGEGGDQPTLEEVIAERDELQKRLDRQRTQKAREARAANRKPKDSPKGGSDDDDETAQELAAEREKNAKLEKRLNTEQAQRVAAELGFKTPSLAGKLIDFNELVDPSDPDEVRDALRDVLKQSPELKKSGSKADGGEGGGTGGSAPRRSFNDMIRSAAGRG